MININNFRSELSDISAKIETMVFTVPAPVVDPAST